MDSTTPDNEPSATKDAPVHRPSAPAMDRCGLLRSQQKAFHGFGVGEATKDSAAALNRAIPSEEIGAKLVLDMEDRPGTDSSGACRGLQLLSDSMEAIEAGRDKVPQARQHCGREMAALLISRSGMETDCFARKPALGEHLQHSCDKEELSPAGEEQAELRNSLKLHGWVYETQRDEDAQNKGRNHCKKNSLYNRFNESGVLYPLSWEEKSHVTKRLRLDSDRLMPQDSDMVLKEGYNSCEVDCGSQQDVIDRANHFIINPLLIKTEYEKGEGMPLESLGGAKGHRDEEMECIGSLSRETGEHTEQHNLEDADEVSKPCDSFCASGEESEMEEGELEPETEVLGSSEGTEEHVEHSPCRNAEGISSHENLELDINDKLGGDRNLEDENEGFMEFGTDMPVEQNGEVETSDTRKEIMQQRLLDMQLTTSGTKVHQDYKINAGDDDGLQKDYTESHETHITRESGKTGEMDLECKNSDAAFLHQSTKGEGYTGLALDFVVDRKMTAESKHENKEPFDLHVKVENRDLLRESDDFGKELTLSLSISLPATEHRDRFGIKVGRRKDVLPMDLQKQKELQRVNNINMSLSEDGLNGSNSVKFADLSFERRGPNPEPIHLSLAFPDTSTRCTTSCPSQSANALELEKTVQSVGPTCTNSDAFTSFSFSHSHPFSHNPSCSLTNASFDNQELSCGNQQISQGNEQAFHRNRKVPLGNGKVSHGSHGLSGNSEDIRKPWQEGSLHQRTLQSGSFQTHRGFHRHSGGNKSLLMNEQPYDKVCGNQFPQGGHQMLQTNTCEKVRLENEEQMHGCREQDKTHHPVRSTGSQGTKAFHYSQSERGVLVPDRERYTHTLQKTYIVKDEDAVGTKSLGNERIGLLEIVTEPIVTMSRKLQELPDSFLEGLKDMVKEMLINIEKREEFISLQKLILKRTDLTQESLLRAHRTQLELLLALKTGVQAFVHPDCKSLTYKTMIEIFLLTRCRNFCCQAQLPVDGCECKICTQKSGFCNACMCVVCSKFDFEAKTCRWVGCDYCMHWCHTDCGIRMLHIVPGRSIPGASETSGMQFRCVACGHNSELFGFVKEVFTNFVNDWNAEILARELDCVRRMFHGSEDMRGKQLFWKAEEMLQKLENKFDIRQICRSMVRFFTEGNVDAEVANISKPLNSKAASNHVVGPIWDAVPKLNLSGRNKFFDLDKSPIALQGYNRAFEEKKTDVPNLLYNRTRERAEIEELERIVRIKLAEAKMFRLRADEARQEADALQHIAAAKSEKIDHDYALKLVKLGVNEAQEHRRKKLEELHILEKAQDDYKNLKMTMEVDIKDLLEKMETTKQQLA